MSKTKQSNANATKTNNTYDSMFNELLTAKCKNDLVTTMLKYGMSTTTSPTTTPNANDLYIQFNDFSRVWLRKSRIDFLSTVDTCNSLKNALDENKVDYDKFFGVIEKSDNGCSKRTHRLEKIEKTANAFNTIINFLLENNAIKLIEK